MYEMQRQASAGIDYVLTRRGGRDKLLLLDMDGTVTTSRFAAELARVTGHESALMGMLDRGTSDVAGRSENIGRLFQYVHRSQLEHVARSLEIRPGVRRFVNQMRRRGFLVGLISDSYFIAAELVRRRISADFAMTHTIAFENDVCTGNIRLNPAFLTESGRSGQPICKSNVLRRFLDDKTPPRSSCPGSPATTSMTWN